MHRINCEENKSINCVKGSFDNSILAAGGEEGSVKLWNIDNDNFNLKKITELNHLSVMTGIDIMPNNKMVCATFKDKSCRLYEINSGLHTKTLYFSRTCDTQGLMFKGCYFSSDNSYLYTIQTGPKSGSFLTK